jgi:hypothetical protein
MQQTARVFVQILLGCPYRRSPSVETARIKSTYTGNVPFMVKLFCINCARFEISSSLIKFFFDDFGTLKLTRAV